MTRAVPRAARAPLLPLTVRRAGQIARRMGAAGVGIVSVEYGAYPRLHAQTIMGAADESDVRRWAAKLGAALREHSSDGAITIIAFDATVFAPSRETAQRALDILAGTAAEAR